MVVNIFYVIECECHLIGSLETRCNQTTGQCICKDGVSGVRCDRCLPGYRQTKHASIPCKSKYNLHLFCFLVILENCFRNNNPNEQACRSNKCRKH